MKVKKKTATKEGQAACPLKARKTTTTKKRTSSRKRKTADEKFEELKAKFMAYASQPPEVVDALLDGMAERDRSLFCYITGYSYRGGSKIDVLKGLGISETLINATVAKAKRKLKAKRDGK